MTLAELLKSIEVCNACGLMADNAARRVSPVPVKAKPNARVMVVGRDPSPRTAPHGADLGNSRSVFVREITGMAERAGVSAENIYFTNALKCHWHTGSKENSLPNTEARSKKVPAAKARTCMDQWLVREIEILQPKLIVIFGAELYRWIQRYVAVPYPAPKDLSATVDKSVLDAEYWFVHNGPLQLRIGDKLWPLVILRHAGGLRNIRGQGDLRHEYYERSVERVVALLKQTRE